MSKKMSVLNKLITFLNDVTDEAEAIVEVAADDTTNSAEVTLSFTLDSGDVVTVDAERYVRDVNMELLEEGSYLLNDGKYITVDAEGKFVETAEESVEDAPVEAPIAEKKVAKQPTKIKQSKIKKAIKQEDEVADAPSTATVSIDGVDYEVPQEVADYIKKLESELNVIDAEIEQHKTKINKYKAELSTLKGKTPSAKPVSSVQSVNQSKAVETVEDAIIANLKNKWS